MECNINFSALYEALCQIGKKTHPRVKKKKKGSAQKNNVFDNKRDSTQILCIISEKLTWITTFICNVATKICEQEGDEPLNKLLSLNALALTQWDRGISISGFKRDI